MPQPPLDFLDCFRQIHALMEGIERDVDFSSDSVEEAQDDVYKATEAAKALIQQSCEHHGVKLHCELTDPGRVVEPEPIDPNAPSEPAY